ncbi:MAG: hypothetical protein Q4C61_17650 [Lachnospiraceae bacterium]|nr:hypothetical protein [Lachnospiraceae bacterium]
MKKKLAGMLAAVLLFCSCGSYTQTVWAAGTLDEYTQIKDDSYQPEEQGYYGYFPVSYGLEQATTSTGIPALVKGGHTYLDAADICERLGMTCTVDPATGSCSVGAWQRTVTFQKDSEQCEIQMGPFLMEASMPLKTVYQDETLWVGAEWFFWMTGGTFFPLPDGYVVIGAPKETALDVAAELYTDDGAFDYTEAFGLSADALRELDKAFNALDVYDGMLNFEWDKWVAATGRYPQGAFIPDSEMYDLVTDSSSGADFMKLLLENAADEAYSIADPGRDIGEWALDKYLEYVEKFYEDYSQNADNISSIAAKMASDYAEAQDYTFAQALGRYSNKKICQSLDAARKSNAFEALGKGAKTLSALADFAGCWKDYSDRDTYALEGAQTAMDVLEQSKKLGLGGLPQGVVQSMKDVLETYENGQTEFAFTKWFTENIGGYVGDAVTGMLGTIGLPVELYQLGSRLIPQYVSGLEEAEAFEMSLEGILYQSSAYTAFKAAAEDCFTRKKAFFLIRNAEKVFNINLKDEMLDQVVAQAYHYVKTRYVTRKLALTALQSKEELQVYQAQAALCDRDLERLKVLAGYCKEDLPVPSQWTERASGYDDSYLKALVTPAYLHLNGSFLDVRTKMPVSDVAVQVQDPAENVLAEFVSREDGSFDFYVPLSWNEEEAHQMYRRLPQAAGVFLPWEKPYSSSFAYPQLQEEAPIVFTCSHPDYPELTKTFSSLEMTELEGTGASRELRLDAGKIFLGIDYYQFIHDELLPDMGFASLETAQKEVGTDFYDMGWDRRTGLLGADIADLNLDGIEDLLVYYITEDTEYTPSPGGGYPKKLCAALYSVNEDGQIVCINNRRLAGFNDVTYERIKLGLMGRDDRVYLYVETDSYAYFANGGSVSYTWYCWDEKGALRPRWMIGHTDGGSIELASSLLDYYGEDAYDKYVLCADGEFRRCYPDVEVLTDDDGYAYETEGALRAGFAMLGLDGVGLYQGSPNIYFTQVGRLPTCWGTSLMKESSGYLCTGQRTDGGQSNIWQMTTYLEDRSGLREKMAEIDSAGK